MIIYTASVLMSGMQKNTHFPICISRSEPYSLVQKVNAFLLIEEIVSNHTHYEEGYASVIVGITDTSDGDSETHELNF
jgi:hypothetical protein